MFALVSSNFLHIDIPQDIPCETCLWVQVIYLNCNLKGHETLSKRLLPFFLERWLSILNWFWRNHESYFEEVVEIIGIILGEKEEYFFEIFVLDGHDVNEVLHFSLSSLPWFIFKATSWILVAQFLYPIVSSILPFIILMVVDCNLL